MARCTGHIHHGEQVIVCNKDTHPSEEPCTGWLLVQWQDENNHKHDELPPATLIQNGVETPIS